MPASICTFFCHIQDVDPDDYRYHYSATSPKHAASLHSSFRINFFRTNSPQRSISVFCFHDDSDPVALFPFPLFINCICGETFPHPLPENSNCPLASTNSNKTLFNAFKFMKIIQDAQNPPTTSRLSAIYPRPDPYLTPRIFNINKNQTKNRQRV